MGGVYLGSIESLLPIVLGCTCWKSACSARTTAKEGRSTNSCDKAKRRLQCPSTPKILDMVKRRDARSATVSLVWFGTTRGGIPFVQRGASIASELGGKVTAP